MTTATSPTASVRVAAPQSKEVISEAGWARTAAGAGVVFVVASLASTFLPGAPPASDASAAKVATYFQDHTGAIKAQQLIGALGIVALLWWSGAIWRLLSRAEGGQPRLTVVAALSLVAGLALAMLNGVLNSTAAIRVDSASEFSHLLWSMSLVAIAAAGIGIGTFLTAACAITYRTNIAPRWVSYLGWVAALAFFVGAGGIATDSSAINLFALVAFLLWCVWILAMSAVLWRTAAE